MLSYDVFPQVSALLMSASCKSIRLMILKIQNFYEKKDPSLPAAGIRAQVFRLPVDCSKPLSYGGAENNLFLTET